ncbi:MAG TPA: hypothetical protein DCF49_03110 [Lachnospiraceae bacterium]|nr:hypothetical protein [Lachnospiraceae bacterium]
MRLQDQVYELYKKNICENMEENRRGALAMKEALEKSPLNYKGVMEKTLQIPKVFDRETVEHFSKITEISVRIFDKVVHEYKKNPEYRKLFPFSKELEELILLPPSYDGNLAIARLDIFYDQSTGDFRFCEINTDGTAAMYRDLEMRKALIYNPAHKAAEEKFDLRPFELFDSWVQTFLGLYDTYDQKREHPFVVMADFLENATIKEFEEFKRSFEKAGIQCEICDIRTLRYTGGALYTEEGRRIDAVYRRAVTADIMDHYEEVRDFIEAVRNDDVFVAGAFQTQIIHNKWIFHVLRHESTKAFLTEEEVSFVEEHIPLTLELSDGYISLEEVRRTKDRWIIKPMDAYASKGIYAAGKDYAQADWDRLTGDLYGKGYLCQEYCRQYMTENIDFAWGDGEWHPYINMPGLYVYNGKFAGVLMRMACGENIIVAHENERTVPVFQV